MSKAVLNGSIFIVKIDLLITLFTVSNCNFSIKTNIHTENTESTSALFLWFSVLQQFWKRKRRMALFTQIYSTNVKRCDFWNTKISRPPNATVAKPAWDRVHLLPHVITKITIG